MKAQLTMNARKWSLYGALLSAMAYSALTLTSEPAYAGTCTVTRCDTLFYQCNYDYCAVHGGRLAFSCPAGNSNNAYCQCRDADFFVIPC
jgi:hypothetical protein